MTTTPSVAPVVVDTAASPNARLRGVGVGDVRLHDAFWQPRREINRRVTLPSQHAHLESTHRLANFRRAAGRIGGDFVGIYYNDSDVYKWLEAAAWELAADDDPELRQLIDPVVDDIAAAQQPDGYLNSYFMFDKAAERFTNLRDKHELYCGGHMIQAAVAHARATGSDALLTVATRFADHVDATFGDAPGKRPGACGHPEAEMALVELARLTGEPRYLALARHMIDARGHNHLGGRDYHQDHAPFRDVRHVVGHAVRALYLAAGATDVVLDSTDAPLLEALQAQWQNMTRRRLYVTGGVGARYEGEAFGKDFELPNERAYAETCAAIASVMWNWRMLLLTGQPAFADLIEWTLYNGVLPGLSLDGQSYFYQNPLADDGTHRRQPWFGCACCPPNVARMLSSLPGYFYAVDDDAAWIHLYAQSDATLTLGNGLPLRIRQRTDYPWDGRVRIEIDADGDAALMLRIPAWAEGATVREPGGGATPATAGTYHRVARRWQAGDVVELHLPMPPRRVEAHPHVSEDHGRIALARGPILYCVEGVDHPGLDVRDLVLPDDAELRDAVREDLLGGVVTLTADAAVAPPDAAWADHESLYRPLRRTREQTREQQRDTRFTAVPYYAWANRAPGGMAVWLRRDA